MKLELLEGNWTYYFGNQVSARGAGNDSYWPIPDFNSSYLTWGRVVAVEAFSTNSPPTHRLAGWVKQLIRSGINPGANTDTIGVTAKYYMDKVTLVYLPEIADEWALQFSIPYWIQQESVNVWVYHGPVTERYDAILEEIKTAVIP